MQSQWCKYAQQSIRLNRLQSIDEPLPLQTWTVHTAQGHDGPCHSHHTFACDCLHNGLSLIILKKITEQIFAWKYTTFLSILYATLSWSHSATFKVWWQSSKMGVFIENLQSWKCLLEKCPFHIKSFDHEFNLGANSSIWFCKWHQVHQQSKIRLKSPWISKQGHGRKNKR